MDDVVLASVVVSLLEVVADLVVEKVDFFALDVGAVEVFTLVVVALDVDLVTLDVGVVE